MSLETLQQRLDFETKVKFHFVFILQFFKALVLHNMLLLSQIITKINAK